MKERLFGILTVAALSGILTLIVFWLFIGIEPERTIRFIVVSSLCQVLVLFFLFTMESNFNKK